MGSQQTLEVLQSYASLLDQSADRLGSEGVRALAAALSTAGDAATIKSTVARVKKLVTSGYPSPGAPPTLGLRLSALTTLLATGGAKSTLVSDISLLRELIQNTETVGASQFEQALGEAIQTPLPPSKTKASKQVPLTESEIRHFADRLTAAIADREAFENELSHVTKFSVGELKAIAEHFLGHKGPKGKPKIIASLRSRQQQDAVEAARQGRLSRIAV